MINAKNTFSAPLSFLADFESAGKKRPTSTGNLVITAIRKATLNGRAVKLFKAWKKEGNALVFAGEFSAPARTANKNLAALVA